MLLDQQLCPGVGGRKCGAFMSPIFRDAHPTCAWCRGRKCTSDVTCDICNWRKLLKCLCLLSLLQNMNIMTYIWMNLDSVTVTMTGFLGHRYTPCCEHWDYRAITVSVRGPVLLRYTVWYGRCSFPLGWLGFGVFVRYA